MSVQAISWVLGLEVENPIDKFVLVAVANYADDYGVCWPKQETIRQNCGCSERKVRDALNRFEERGLITRLTRRRPDGSRRSDVIVLTAFDGRKPLDSGVDHAVLTPQDMGEIETRGTINRHTVPPDNRHDVPPINRQITTDQPANDDQNNRHVVPVYIEPSLEPSEDPSEDDEVRASARSDFPTMVAEIAEALGDPQIAGEPYWSQEAESGTRICRWRELGLSDAQIVEVARRHGREQPEPPKGPKALNRAMEREAKRVARHAAPRASPKEQLRFFAAWVNGEQYIPPSAISPTMTQSLVREGMVTPERARERGLAT